MKTLLISLFLIAGLNSVDLDQVTQTMTASFDRIEDDFYYFIDEDDKMVEFRYIEADASEKYDLTDEEFIGKTFIIKYTIDTETDEEGEEEIVYTIVDLELKE